MDLTSIKETAQEIAVSISRVVEVDVLIVDARLDRIADTFRYPYNDSLDIHSKSIIGRIIQSGRPLVIDNKDYFQSCVDCKNYARCRMQGLIGVPILYQEEAIGAIGLVVDSRNVHRLVENVNPVLSFLQQMADLLSDKLANQANYASLQSISSQWEYILGTVDSCVVLSDENGQVILHNERFHLCFQIEGNCRGKPLTDLISHPVIGDILDKRRDVADMTIAIPLPNSVFYGHIRAKQMWRDGVYCGAVFSFQNLYDLLPDGLLFSRTLCGGETVAQLCPGELGCRLTTLSELGKPLLLCGEDQDHLVKLAAALHAASGRKGKFVVMDRPASMGAQGFRTGDDMPIFLAHQGTLCLCGVFDLPVYAQQQLAAYLRSKETPQDVSAFSCQLILLGTPETQSSLFVDQDLLDALALYRANIPSPLHNAKQLSALIDACLSHYAGCCGKPCPVLTEDARHLLLGTSWERQTLHKAAEYLVRTCGETISAGQVRSLLDRLEPVNQSVESFEAQEIRRLVSEGLSYEQIANTLKISRSTLYRRIKKYQL